MNVLPVTPPDRVAALHAIRHQFPGSTNEAQCKRLLETLRKQGHCTTFEASRYLDLYDPRARKMELLRLGFDVAMVWRHVETESGELHRIGVCSLRGETSEVRRAA